MKLTVTLMSMLLILAFSCKEKTEKDLAFSEEGETLSIPFQIK